MSEEALRHPRRIHELPRPLARQSLAQSRNHSCIECPTCSFLRIMVIAPTRLPSSLTHPLTHSLTHSLALPATHSCAPSLITHRRHRSLTDSHPSSTATPLLLLTASQSHAGTSFSKRKPEPTQKRAVNWCAISDNNRSIYSWASNADRHSWNHAENES